MPANIFQRATKLWVFLLRMPLSLSPLSVLSTLLSALSSYTQRHLGDALTKRVPNECGKWEYQFDELCYSISAINFPVALLSKMESRMIEPLFRYLILFLGSCLPRVCLWECVREEERGSGEGERFLEGGGFILFVSGNRDCILARSLHRTSFFSFSTLS